MSAPSTIAVSSVQVSTPQQMHCIDCGKIISPWGPIGFCSRCGGPLCDICGMRRIAQTEEKSYGYTIPLITFHMHVSYSKKVRADVTCCKKCMDERRKLWAGSMKLFLLGIPMVLMLFLGIILLMSGFLWAIYIFYIWFVMLLAFAVVLVWRHFKENSIERQYGPFCPACGLNLMPYYLQQIPYQRDRLTNLNHDGMKFPNNIVCPNCSYRGPISPLEGFWRFIDTNGPQQFAGSPLEPLAKASYQIRHVPNINR